MSTLFNATPEVPAASPDTSDQQQQQLPSTADIEPVQTGLDPEQVLAALQQLGIDPSAVQFAVQQTAKQSEEATQRQLREQWGDSYDTNWKVVNERFAKLPAHKQQYALGFFDNDVALANYVLGLAPVEIAPESQPPTFDATSGKPNVNSKYMFTRSQLRAMPRAEYESRMSEIDYAYANGKVDTNN